MFERLRTAIEQSSRFSQLLSSISVGNAGEAISLGGVAGSLLAILVSSLSDSLRKQILVISDDRAKAEQLFDDVALLHGASARLFLADSTQTTQQALQPWKAEAASTLRALAESSVDIVIATGPSLLLPVPLPDLFRSASMTVEAGREISLPLLVQQLNAAGFERKDFVGTGGEYSQRGGILDVFSHAGEYPIRVEFLGDVVESVREFDPLSQRSIREISAATIAPKLFSGDQSQPALAADASPLAYLNNDALVVMMDPELIWKEIDTTGTLETLPSTNVRQQMSRHIQLNCISFSSAPHMIDFKAMTQPSFNGNIKLLRENLLGLKRKQIDITIACDGQMELKRLRELLCEPVMDSVLAEGQPVREEDLRQLRDVEFIHPSLHGGFLLPDLRLGCYTEHQIFGRQKRRWRARKSKQHGFSRKEVQQLHKGDFVVHEDFGIGRFDGLKKIRVRDVEQEVMKLLYEEKDTLYVNLNYLNKVKKYSSKEGHVPKLTRLGTQEWDRLRARAKKRIQDIARDLIRIYARRRSSLGHAFQPDTTWQKELEASFIYEDTFDQAKATMDVKRDMEQQFPMDRLVCGDVGFGKTEVAVRAAFKSVLDGKQVAVLVPTTILAIQHFNTFIDRMSRFSVNIAVLSRLKSKREQQESLERLQAGAIDIIIGTHRLLSQDVSFKDLGLLIIDEEHRFGVAAKEKLRRLRATVDTLTLTATPIPRTLHFSLMGARDLSIIATPPRNRLPITTEITQFDEVLIREAITREMSRGGQVYFVHDRITDIDAWAGKVRALLPAARIRHAHGQMHAHDLEEVMLEFQEKKIDVLVCTKIIESGLDIPNVNTIVINRADRFGLSELYQLKGRVGRSNIQAYAYLLVPPISSLPRTTIQRLQAVEEFTELGSGLNLAMRDLEIRGAGNLLGAEQSGFIESMGFETYTRILDEAVAELKEQEFRDLFPGSELKTQSTPETVMEVELDALIPDNYIQSDTERLDIYRQMYALSTHEQLDELGEELKDRFGPFPIQVHNLLNAVRVRLAAAGLGFKKVLMGRNAIEIEFPENSDKAFYEGEGFQNLMTEISRWKSRGVHLKEHATSLRLTLELQNHLQQGDPIGAALDFFDKLKHSTNPEDRNQNSDTPVGK